MTHPLCSIVVPHLQAPVEQLKDAHRLAGIYNNSVYSNKFYIQRKINHGPVKEVCLLLEVFSKGFAYIRKEAAALAWTRLSSEGDSPRCIWEKNYPKRRLCILGTLLIP